MLVGVPEVPPAVPLVPHSRILVVGIDHAYLTPHASPNVTLSLLITLQGHQRASSSSQGLC
jgi:hypothetical protein